MSNLTLGFMGAVAGLFVATFGNFVVLPFVLKRQDHLPAGYAVPLFGWCKSELSRVTVFAYRYFMPIFWLVFGALIAVLMFGEQQ